MVTVKNYQIRKKEDGQESFVLLELMGDLELIQSSNTGRFYATTRKCMISSTFDEQIAKLMIGKTIKGSIIRIPCEPYEYTIPETGEVTTLSYRWDYSPDEVSEVIERELTTV